MPLLQRRFGKTAVEVKAWMSNYMPLFYVDVPTYPCPYSDYGSANLYEKKRSQSGNLSEKNLISVRILSKYVVIYWKSNHSKQL